MAKKRVPQKKMLMAAVETLGRVVKEMPDDPPKEGNPPENPPADPPVDPPTSPSDDDGGWLSFMTDPKVFSDKLEKALFGESDDDQG